MSIFTNPGSPSACGADCADNTTATINKECYDMCMEEGKMATPGHGKGPRPNTYKPQRITKQQRKFIQRRNYRN